MTKVRETARACLTTEPLLKFPLNLDEPPVETKNLSCVALQDFESGFLEAELRHVPSSKFARCYNFTNQKSKFG
jgi:hypothetical protein